MKKVLVGIAMTLCALSCIGAQGNSETAQQKTVMKIGHVMPEDSPRHKGFLAFKEHVEKETNGRIQVSIYANGQLGQDSELVEMLKTNSVEGFVGGSFDDITPKLNLFGMPFLFPSRSSFLATTENPQMLEMINKDSRKNKIAILAIGDGGARNISNNVRPIRKPEDMKGLKMRTPMMQNVIKCVEALGANPVTIPYGDTYMALKTGVADGQENPNMNMAVMKFYEVQKYLTVINYVWNPEPFCVSASWYDALSPEDQKIVADGAKIYEEVQNDERNKSDAEYLKTMIDYGIDAYTLKPEEMEPFREKCSSVYDFFVSQHVFSQEELDFVKGLAK